MSSLLVSPRLVARWMAGLIFVLAGMSAGPTPALGQGVGAAVEALRDARQRAQQGPIRNALYPGRFATLGATQVGGTSYPVTYRPSGAEYVVEPRAHFDVIYQRGYHDTARRLGNALEATRAGTDSLVRGRDDAFRMPVVVDGFNDRSNGFVTPFPFKQEIEAPALKSNALLERAPSWPYLVGVHEQVHAAQAEVQAGLGVGTVLRWFAPDAARSVNFAAPAGLTEGVAVYRESTVQGDSTFGRLNESLFQMKMRAAMLSDEPWGFTEMMEAPAYTQPFNRHYIGGAYAVRQLDVMDGAPGAAFVRDVMRNHARLPVLGHGIWMWADFGATPAALGNDLQAAFQARFQDEVDAQTEGETSKRGTLVAGRDGLNVRRPYWTGPATVVAYAYGYGTRPGFYRFDTHTGARSTIRVQGLTEDFTYSLTPDTTALLASRYVRDPFVETQAIAEVERVNLQTGDADRRTRHGRTFAPAAASTASGDPLWAIQNDGAWSQWARIEPDGSATPLTGFTNTRFRQIAPSPTDSTVALVINVDGDQRLYRSRRTADGPTRPVPWLGLEGAVIYDVAWGPEGRYLLFSADLGGVANVYSYDTQTATVRRHTRVQFGALEPALSPDRSTLAYVRYRHERHELVTRPFELSQAETVPDSLLALAPRASRSGTQPAAKPEAMGPRLRMDAPPGPPAADVPERRPYQAWRYLAPRITYPVLRDLDRLDEDTSLPTVEDLGAGFGLGVSGTDPLQRWSYQAEAFWQDGRPWGEARVQTGRFRLRPSLFAYNRPDLRIVRGRTGFLVGQVGFEERGVGVGLRLPVTLQDNVYQSVLRLGLEGEVRQTRLYGDAVDEINDRFNGTLSTDFTDRVTLSPSLVLGYRLQQNPRDLVPNTGLAWRNLAEIDAWTQGAAPSRALLSELSVYLPFLKATHTGLELGAGFFTQNRSGVFSTTSYVPRGYDFGNLRPGTYLRLDAEVTQPLWYVDDGLSILPIYLKALSVYGFGQALGRFDGLTWNRGLTSVGGGVGLRLRLFYLLDFNLRVGAAYRLEAGNVGVVFR